MPKLSGSGWPAYFDQVGLGIEQIDVARPAVHEQPDHALDARREVRRSGRQRIVLTRAFRTRQQSFVSQQARQSNRAQTASGAQQELATRTQRRKVQAERGGLIGEEHPLIENERVHPRQTDSARFDRG